MNERHTNYRQEQRSAALELYVSALAMILRELPDAGPGKVMQEYPEVGNLWAAEGRSVKLYEQAAEKAAHRTDLTPFDASRVRHQLMLARQMMSANL
jgi:hypothetical protein